jgi:RNA polymerase sigma factor (sigma-70 family)
MTKQIHPTTQSPGLGSVAGPGFDASLDDLRNGEREAFGRFFETYRSGIYGFVVRLMRGHGDAAAITHEVFVRAYRKILLHSGAIDLRPWVYGVALDTCREHLASLPGHQTLRVPLERDPAPDVDQQSDLVRRFRQASEGLSDRDLAVLLLNDVHGLSHGETAAVMGVSTDAAKTLLFRAGERFRGAFEALSGNQTVATCRFAEQEAAMSVGRGLSADDTRRLRDHARYCEPCRTTTAAWGLGATGLALFVGEAPLPQALQKVPVFGTWAAPVALAQVADAKAAAGMGAVVGALVRFRAVVGSKATAYAVAAVCLAALVGVVMYGSHRELQKVILFVPRPAASTAVVAPRAPAKVAVVHHAAVHHAVRQGTSTAAAHVTLPAHSVATASTTVITTAKLTSVHSSGATQNGKSAASSDDTPSTSTGGTVATTGAAASTTAGSAPSGGGGSSTTAGHSAGTGVGSAVGTAVGAGLSRAGHDGQAARSHRHARHNGQSHQWARTSGRSHSRSHPGSLGARPHSGSSSHSRSHSRGGAANGGGRHSDGGSRHSYGGSGGGQRTHASRSSHTGGARGHGGRGNGGGRSHSGRHGRRSGRG